WEAEQASGRKIEPHETLVRERDVHRAHRLIVDVPTLAGGDQLQQLEQPGPRGWGLSDLEQQVAGIREVVALERESLDVGNIDLSHAAACPVGCPAIRLPRAAGEAPCATVP